MRVNDLLAIPQLHFTTITSVNTGEIFEERPRVAYYKGFKITVKLDNKGTWFAKAEGSIHKFGNEGKYNHDQYDYIRLVNDINQLAELLRIDPQKTILNGLEFGVNLETPYSPDTFLYDVIDHKGVKFNESRGRNKYYREAKHTNYSVKIYNKSKQHRLPKNTLRFEIHCNRMYHLKSIGIRTLRDLMNPAVLSLLGQKLLGHFDELLLFDTLDSKVQINSRDTKILSDGTNHFYWDRLKLDHKENYPKKRKRFKLLVSHYGIYKHRETISGLISKTWNNLLQTQTKTVQDLTILETHFFTGINNWNKRLNQVTISKSPSHYCCVTGLDITHQDEKSKFVSMKTLQFIYYTNKDLYKQLLNDFAPGNLQGKSIDEVCYYIAHNIRNKVSNIRKSRRIRNRRYQNNYKLFAPEEMNVMLQPNSTKPTQLIQKHYFSAT